MQVDAFREKSLLCRASGVAGEEHAKRPVLQNECDRVVVDRVAAADKWHRRADEAQRHTVIRLPDRARARVNNRHAARMCCVETIVIRMSAIRLTAVSDLRDAQSAQHRRTSADVIAMRMRNDHRIDMVDALANEKRHDDSFADTLGYRIIALGAAFQPAAGVDEDRMMPRCLDRDRVGLANIEDGNSQ